MTFNSPWARPKPKPKRKKKAKKKVVRKKVKKKVAKKKVTKKVRKKAAKKRRAVRKARKHPGRPTREEVLDCSTARTSPDKYGGLFCTARSPGGIRDDKVDKAELSLAMAHLGTPKMQRRVTLKTVKVRKKVKGEWKMVDKTDVRIAKLSGRRNYGFPKDGAYLTVAYGGGVDSTAVLVGLDQLWRETRDPKWIPVVVSFADTGGEHPDTYQYIHAFETKWLAHAFKGGPHHPGKIVKCVYGSLQRGNGWGMGYTLEQQNLVNQSLPSISLGQHSCSAKYKIDAQKQWFAAALAAGDIPTPRGRGRIVRAIGYDATESDRLEGHSTYVAKDEETRKGPPFRGWYPLIEWGWNRARCLVEIKAAVSKVRGWPRGLNRAPPKSSCYFCGAMRPSELINLVRFYPELMDRSLFLENVAKYGRHRPHGGLNRQFYWTDFVLANVKKLNNMARVYIQGGVIRRGEKSNRVLVDTLGKPKPRNLADNEVYKVGCGQLMTQSAVDKIIAQAKAYIKAAPDKGKRIPGFRNLRGGEDVAGRKTRIGGPQNKKQVWDKIPDKSKAGKIGKDMALHPMTNKIDAFCNVLGFRKTPRALDWNTMVDKHFVEEEVMLAKAEAQMAGAEERDNTDTKAYANSRKRAEVADANLRKIELMVQRTVQGCRRRPAANPRARRLPVVNTYVSPFEVGL